jgi:hypothetical protein
MTRGMVGHSHRWNGSIENWYPSFCTRIEGYCRIAMLEDSFDRQVKHHHSSEIMPVVTVFGSAQYLTCSKKHFSTGQ